MELPDAPSVLDGPQSLVPEQSRPEPFSDVTAIPECHRMVTAVCFDLDGTLYDDRQYVRAGFERAARLLEAETGEDLYEEFLAAFFERGVRDRTFDRVLERRGLSTDRVPELVAAYHGHDTELEPYPEARAVLDDLESRYDLAVLTDGTNGRSKLDRLGLARYFDVTLVTADTPVTKRDARPFRDVLSSLSADPEQAVYVGDRPDLDFPRPNAIGMHTVRVRRGTFRDAAAADRAEPDRTVETLAELPDAIAALDAE